MIDDALAGPITKCAVKAFTHHYVPDKPSLKVIFHYHWKEFLSFASEHNYTIRDDVIFEVEQMLKCSTLQLDFELFECPHCHNTHIIAYTCKSRFCPSCGVAMTRARARTISTSTLDVKHRHMVFTIDVRLRVWFLKHREWLAFLFSAAQEAILHTFNKSLPSSKKKHRKKKEKKKNRQKKKSITPGMIMTIHTFGRDLKWNPHLHVLCTEGSMDQNGVYRAVTYINYESLRKSFRKQLLDKMKAALPKGSKEYIEKSQLISKCYQDYEDGFYVNAPPNGMDEKGKDKVVSYIIRYTGRPAMAQSRISSYSYEKKEISYWYDDHKTNEHITVTEHVYLFMLKLIRHIPNRNFKMTRYYGIYACADHKHKKNVRLKLKQKSINSSYRRLHYRRSLITVFGVDPLLCTCGHYMEYVDSYVPSRSSCGNDPP